jgi:maleamate amidohydrolase
MAERVWDRFLTDMDKKVIGASGWRKRQGFGKRPALLVIDVNYAFAGDRPEPILDSIKRWHTSCGEVAWKSIPIIKKLADLCRRKGVPVIYTTGETRPDKWDAGSWRWKNARNSEDPIKLGKTNLDGNEIVPEIAPAPQDIVIKKGKPSAFSGSPLGSYLTLLGCDSLIVTGTTTSGCVRSTVVDGFSNNYRVTVVEDGCFDRAEASHAVSLLDMDMRYADVIESGEVWKYLEDYPAGQFELPTGKAI